MPGGPAGPERPVRKRSRNPDCVGYRPSEVWKLLIVFPFGLVFTLTGTLGLCAAANCLLMIAENYSDYRYWLGILGVAVIGIGHAAAGLGMLYFVFLCPEWLSIDRKLGVARKQIGVLCFRRFATAKLADFTEVSIFPIPITLFVPERFEVALTGPDERRFSLGQVTLSYDLAREFGEEVATFLGLPLL